MWIETKLAVPKEAGYYLVVCYRYCDRAARKKYGHEKSIQVLWFNKGSDDFLGLIGEQTSLCWMPLPTLPEGMTP